MRRILTFQPCCGRCCSSAAFSTQSPVALLNCNYDPSVAVQREIVTPVQAEHWLDQLAQTNERNEYLFSLLAVVTSAVRGDQ